VKRGIYTKDCFTADDIQLPCFETRARTRADAVTQMPLTVRETSLNISGSISEMRHFSMRTSQPLVLMTYDEAANVA
jgi:hypothetical protein